jgi:hypothetical protein
MSTTTDSRGRFAFDTVPERDAPLELHITARGREMVRAVKPKEMNQGEVIIHFDL